MPGRASKQLFKQPREMERGRQHHHPPGTEQSQSFAPCPRSPPALPPPGARSPRGAAGTLPGAPPAPGERTAARGRRVKQLWGLTKLNKLQKELARGVVHTSQACVSLSLTPPPFRRAPLLFGKRRGPGPARLGSAPSLPPQRDPGRG